MPRHSRRALLEMLGSGTVTLLAGCQADSRTDTPTEIATPTPALTEAPTASSSTTETGTETPTRTPGDLDCANVSPPETAWPVPRRSPARDGYISDPNGFEDTPVAAWEAEPTVPEESDASPLYGQPVVGHGVVYVSNLLDRGPELQRYGYIHAIDVESGDRKWASRRLRSPSYPTIWGDRVVVVAEDESLNTRVLSLDPANGTPQWTREFEAGDIGFVPAGEDLYLIVEEASERGTVYALAKDGSTHWIQDGAFTDHITEGPTVGTDHFFAVTRDGQLHALTRNDGNTDWTYQFEHPSERRPYVTDLVATDCAAFAVVEGALKALDNNGILVWEVYGEHGAMATNGETLFVAADSENGERELRAFNAATGEVRWTVGGQVKTYEPPVVAGNAVLVPFDEHIVALNSGDGRERWRADVSMRDLALADGMLFGTAQESLLALR